MKFSIYELKAFIWDQSQLSSSICSWDISETKWILRLKMAKKTILLQKSSYNVIIIDWNWKNYKRSETLKQRAFIWDQSQLCSSFHSRDISKTRWILGKNDHLVAKKLFIMWQLLTGIGKIIRGLETLNKELSFGTNPSSVAQFVPEI